VKATDRTAKAIALAPDGRLAIRERDRITIWDTATAACLVERPMAVSVGHESLLWLPTGELVVTSRAARRSRWDSGERCIKLLHPDLAECATQRFGYACSLACCGSGDLLALGSWNAGLVFRRDVTTRSM
jgi:hypothetical protein